MASPLQALYSNIIVRQSRVLLLFFAQGIPAPKRSFVQSAAGRLMG